MRPPLSLEWGRPGRALRVALCVCASCAPAQSGSVVSAPTEPRAASAEGSQGASAAGDNGALDACALPWTLESVGGGSSSVVVTCGSDVRRQSLSSSRALSRAIAPALEPARERVCACASRMPVPAFVDLVVTAMPEEGRASVQASDPEDEADAERGPPFVACVGTVVATFSPSKASEVCPGAKAVFSYPLRVELLR